MSSTNINVLPNEIITNILKYLDSEDLARCTNVCERWKELVEHPYLWRILYKRMYKKECPSLDASWLYYYGLMHSTPWDNLLLEKSNNAHFDTWKPLEIDQLDTTNENGFPLFYSPTSQYKVIDFKKDMIYLKFINSFKPMIHCYTWLLNTRNNPLHVYSLHIELYKDGHLVSEYCDQPLTTVHANHIFSEINIYIASYPDFDTLKFIHLVQSMENQADTCDDMVVLCKAGVGVYLQL